LFRVTFSSLYERNLAKLATGRNQAMMVDSFDYSCWKLISIELALDTTLLHGWSAVRLFPV
jgi:hypothetical protein